MKTAPVKTAAAKTAPVKSALKYGELDRVVVVDAVLALARRDGLEKLTMRALAAEIGMSPASLYYHVPTKEALLELAADTVLAGVELPPADLPWQEQLRELFSRGRSAMLPIDGIAGVLQSRPLSSAGRLLDDVSVRILGDAGFSRPAARSAQMLLGTFVLGAVQLEQAMAKSHPDSPRRRASRAADFATGLDTILLGLQAQA